MSAAVLLVNLGTPSSLTHAAVKSYLTEFLMDPNVVDLPYVMRWVLVHLLIVPRRTTSSLKLYQKIWTAAGSPLRVNTERLVRAVQKPLAGQLKLYWSMRYGQPSIASTLKHMRAEGVKQFILLPLYPQYANATTLSTQKEVTRCLQAHHDMQLVHTIDTFYAAPFHIDAWVSRLQPQLNTQAFDCVLFSYHGLPKRQIEKGAEAACRPCCAADAICTPPKRHTACYRAACFDTTRRIAEALGLQPDQYVTAFQSRLGRLPWIAPYTDEMLQTLRDRGVQRLVVVSPAFVADCLESLEEVDMGLRAAWTRLGGATFTYVNCLNDDLQFSEGLASFLLCQAKAHLL